MVEAKVKFTPHTATAGAVNPVNALAVFEINGQAPNIVTGSVDGTVKVN